MPKSGSCPQLFGRREIPKVRAESDYDHDHFLEGLLNLTVPKSGNCPQLFGRREIPKRRRSQPQHHVGVNQHKQLVSLKFKFQKWVGKGGRGVRKRLTSYLVTWSHLYTGFYNSVSHS